MSTKRATAYVSLLLTIVTFGYGVFQARNLIAGPHITLTSPTPGSGISETTYEVRGVVKNITKISINGAPILADVHGSFSATYSTPDGFGVIRVTGEDRFGRTTATQVEVFGVL